MSYYGPIIYSLVIIQAMNNRTKELGGGQYGGRWIGNIFPFFFSDILCKKKRKRKKRGHDRCRRRAGANLDVGSGRSSLSAASLGNESRRSDDGVDGDERRINELAVHFVDDADPRVSSFLFDRIPLIALVMALRCSTGRHRAALSTR